MNNRHGFKRRAVQLNIRKLIIGFALVLGFVSGQTITVAVSQQGQRRDARAATFVGAEIGKNLLCGFGLLSEHQL